MRQREASRGNGISYNLPSGCDYIDRHCTSIKGSASGSVAVYNVYYPVHRLGSVGKTITEKKNRFNGAARIFRRGQEKISLN